jgi:hypothetical protein
MTRRTSVPVLFVVFALVLGPAAFAADVGEVVLVRNQVRGTPPGGAVRALTAGDGVALGLTVETGADSAAKLAFDPSGALTLGPRARVVVDRARVDQATGRADSALSLLTGQIRLALGRLFRGEVAIDTPTAVVGVKGTDLRVEVEDGTGTTTVVVTEGVVEVRSKAGGTVTVRAGRRTVVAAGQPPTPPAPLEPGAAVLAAAAGGPAFTPPQSLFADSPLVGLEEVFVRPFSPNDPDRGGTGPRQ